MRPFAFISASNLTQRTASHSTQHACYPRILALHHSWLFICGNLWIAVQSPYICHSRLCAVLPGLSPAIRSAGYGHRRCSEHPEAGQKLDQHRPHSFRRRWRSPSDELWIVSDYIWASIFNSNSHISVLLIQKELQSSQVPYRLMLRRQPFQ